MDAKEKPVDLAVKLFWDLANAMPSENHTTRVLRSYYLTTAKNIGRRDLKLPAAKFAPSVMCPKCSSIWLGSKYSLKLKPQCIHSAKARKLVETLIKDPKSLTKKQRNRAKWLKKTIRSNVEIKCEFCQKKTQHALIKPKKSVNDEKKVSEPVEEIPMKKKKKKKMKDKSAGLKLNKVMKTEPKPCPPPKKDKKSKLPQKIKAEKVTSKTQKQNSLLQLANMLKNRTPAGTGSSNANNRLEKLLR